VWFGETTAVVGANFKLAPILTLTANDITRRFGQDNPPLTFRVDGVLAGDSLSSVQLTTSPLTTSAGRWSPAGVYAISWSGPATSGQGYWVMLVDGTLTVSPGPPFFPGRPPLPDFAPPHQPGPSTTGLQSSGVSALIQLFRSSATLTIPGSFLNNPDSGGGSATFLSPVNSGSATSGAGAAPGLLRHSSFDGGGQGQGTENGNQPPAQGQKNSDEDNGGMPGA
jgi:hypothetical protein